MIQNKHISTILVDYNLSYIISTNIMLVTDCCFIRFLGIIIFKMTNAVILLQNNLAFLLWGSGPKLCSKVNAKEFNFDHVES